MKKICIIPMCPRTGSSYLNRFIKKYKDCFYLGEFLDPFYILRPYKNDDPVRNLVEGISDHHFIRKIIYKREEYNKTLTEIWKPDWFTINYYLDNKFKIKLEKKHKPNYEDVPTVLKHNVDIILNSQESILFKMFPMWIQNQFFSNVTIDIFKNIEEDLQLIYLKRKNILDICLSFILAKQTGFFTFLNDATKFEINKDYKFNCDVSFINTIFNNIVAFEKTKNELKNIKSTTIYYEDMFDDNKLLKQLDLKQENKNEFILPKKLYPSQSFEDKMNCIENQDEFYNEYNKGMEILKQQEIEI